MRKLRWIAVLLITGPAIGFAAATSPGAELFEVPEPLEIRIEAPWTQLTRGMEAGKSETGHLFYRSETDGWSSLQVRISTRGLSRLEVCDFPLLTLEFQPEETLGSPFETAQIIHLTTQCRKDLRSRDSLILEYLSYQSYQILGEVALGVRLASVEYLNNRSQRSRGSSIHWPSSSSWNRWRFAAWAWGQCPKGFASFAS